MVLNPIRIFRGSFVGETLYQNPHYQPPNEVIIDSNSDVMDGNLIIETNSAGLNK